ncbi:unnamed protein product [Linum tenue]|uniref:carbonic anhydrase n=1 Tax=Linum tenue TaxID=586396 RepID=A0AAV0K962_9ROSI|nr:unnamed protein product [Linum tenue]
MVSSIRSKLRNFIATMAAPPDLRLSLAFTAGEPFHCPPSSTVTSSSFLGFLRNCPNLASTRIAKVHDHRFHLSPSVGRKALKLHTSVSCDGFAQETGNSEVECSPNAQSGLDFEEMKQRFLSFKKQTYMKKLEHFRALAEMQFPKFMVIACVDSRVCPSNILGFQPGEAFMIRNVANIVPPLECGPTETNAALEFAVNTLQVENIFIVGHSDCAGIQTLMSMQEENSRFLSYMIYYSFPFRFGFCMLSLYQVNSIFVPFCYCSFTEKWVANAKAAKFTAEADASHLSFEQQCKHCEKESINRSLLNLLTYPWIEEKVSKGLLSVHGGYYDFHNCTFEKWTIDYEESSIGQGRLSVKDTVLWC